MPQRKAKILSRMMLDCLVGTHAIYRRDGTNLREVFPELLVGMAIRAHQDRRVPITISLLSRTTTLPRATVRRSLAHLITTGHVISVGKGRYRDRHDFMVDTRGRKEIERIVRTVKIASAKLAWLFFSTLPDMSDIAMMLSTF